MKKLVFSTLVFSSFLFAEDFSFDMDELDKMEVKSYEYSGYIKAEQKHQVLNESSVMYKKKDKSSMDTYIGEAFLNYKYYKDDFTFSTDIVARYENLDKEESDTYTLNQAVLSYKYDENNKVEIGKKTAKWGKGYYFNPIGFIDRKKNPSEPEASREGYTQVNYKYNKVLNGDLQNISFDVVYLKTSEDFNEDLYSKDSNALAFKTYMLYRDIDIDLAYYYNDEVSNKLGIDFSTNLDVNFEIHAEYAKSSNDEDSYLAGLKYITNTELTIISEYFYQDTEQEKTTPFWDNQYMINSFTQKELFDILYFNMYYKNTLNVDDKSFLNKLGITYSGIKNIDIDFSVSKYDGDDTSEFGGKLVDKFSWIQMKYSF